MFRTLGVLALVGTLAGCAMTPPRKMDRDDYMQISQDHALMELCHQAGYINTHDAAEGLQYSHYVLQRLNYNPDTYQKFLSYQRNRFQATQSNCQTAALNVKKIILAYKGAQVRDQRANQYTQQAIDQLNQSWGRHTFCYTLGNMVMCN